MSEPAELPELFEGADVSLLDTVDHLLNKGLVLTGEVTWRCPIGAGENPALRAHDFAGGDSSPVVSRRRISLMRPQ